MPLPVCYLRSLTDGVFMFMFFVPKIDPSKAVDPEVAACAFCR